jgi:hypothetical protein
MLKPLRVFLVTGWAVLLGCSPRLPGLAPAAAPSSSRQAVALTGRVELSALRYAIQATMSDVANGATVSLIDTTTNTTVSTALTTPSGAFNLQLSNSFRPVNGQSYVLEAYKGLSNNLPSNNSARIRTIIVSQGGGWTSLTGAGSITISRSTTAIAAVMALRNAAGITLTPASLIGTITVGTPDSSLSPTTPDTFTPVTNCSNADFHATWSAVDQALTANRDPVQAIAYNSGTNTFSYAGGSLFVTSISPSAGTVGSTLTVSGGGFDATPANNTVLFGGGTSAVAASASANSFAVTVPSGALTGAVTVRVGNLYCIGPSFSVTPSVSGFSPATATTSTSVTITGTGFDPTASNDTVSFNGNAATVTAASATSLTVTVPSAATTGTVTVSTPGGTATSAGTFTVLPRIASFSVPAATNGAQVTIYGTGFAATGSVSFNGVAATTTSWNNTSIAATVPAGASTGPVIVSNAAGASNGANFVVASRVDAHNPFDPAGNMHVDDYSTKVMTINPAGSITTVNASASWNLNDATTTSNGDAFYADHITALSVLKFPSGVSNPTTIASGISYACGAAMAPNGDVFISDKGASAIYRVTQAGQVTVLANGLSAPWGLATDAYGTLYVACQGDGAVRTVNPNTGAVAVFATGVGTDVHSLAVAMDGTVYFVDEGGSNVGRISNGIVNPTWSANVGGGGHYGLALDNSGTIYAPSNSNLYKVSPITGVATLWTTATGSTLAF